jgi:hypothetical protein
MSEAHKAWLYDLTDTHTCTDSFHRFIVDYEQVTELFLFTGGQTRASGCRGTR